MEYPDLEDALLAYAEALGVSVQTARDALLNRGVLESALAPARNAAAYEDADIARQAATLFWGMAAGHPFRDGNKRTAVVPLRAFLDVNGYELDLSEDERFELAVAVAGDRWDVRHVEAVLRKGVRRRRQPPRKRRSTR